MNWSCEVNRFYLSPQEDMDRMEWWNVSVCVDMSPVPGCVGCAVFGPVCVCRGGGGHHGDGTLDLATHCHTLPHIAGNTRQDCPAPVSYWLAPYLVHQVERRLGLETSQAITAISMDPAGTVFLCRRNLSLSSYLFNMFIHRVHLKSTNIWLLIKCYLPRCLSSSFKSLAVNSAMVV